MKELKFFVAEAFEYLLRGKGTSFASVVALSAVLFLFALVLLVSHNIERMATQLTAREGLTVFLGDGVSESEARDLGVRLAGFGEVLEARFVSRDDALVDLERELGGFSVEEVLGENPLPHSLMISLRPEAIARAGTVEQLAAVIRGYSEVDDVVFGDEWLAALERGLAKVRVASLAVGGLAALAVGIVLLTTLKLVFVGRRETLRILKVVGATHRFIRSPFLVLGGLQCLLGGVVALGLLYAARWFLATWLPGFAFLPAGQIVLFLAAVIVYGVFAALIAIEPALQALERGREEVLR